MDDKSNLLVKVLREKMEEHKKTYPEYAQFLDECLNDVIGACEEYWKATEDKKYQVVDDFTGYKELPAERKKESTEIMKFFKCAKCGVYGIPLFYDKCYFCNCVVVWAFSKEYTEEHKFYDQWIEHEKKIDF